MIIINLLELPKELILEILSKIDYWKDNKSLIETAPYFRKRIGGEIFKERFLPYFFKNKFINNNYVKFKKYINLLNKKELHNIFLLSLSNIKTVWMNEVCGFYDMRYIFECMYNGCRIKDKDIRYINKVKGNATHFYLCFYNDLL